MSNSNIKKEAFVGTALIGAGLIGAGLLGASALPTAWRPLAGRRSFYSGVLNRIGKADLAKQSESYESLLGLLEELDKFFRESFQEQRQLMKDIYWAKLKNKLGEFTVSVDKFINIQTEVLKIFSDEKLIAEINRRLGLIPYELYKKDAPENLTNIDYQDTKIFETFVTNLTENYGKDAANWKDLVSKEIKKREKPKPAEAPTPPAPPAPPAVKGSFVEGQLIKQALAEGWIAGMHYSKLKSGKEYKNALNTVYNTVNRILELNQRTLTRLNPCFDKGDPEEYLKILEGLYMSSVSYMISIKPVWDKYFEALAEKYKKEGTPQEDKDENGPPAAGSPAAGSPAESPVKPVVPSPDNPSPDNPSPDNPSPGNIYVKEQYPEGGLSAPAFDSSIISQLNKIAISTQDPKEVAREIAKYALSIEDIDEDLAMKLIAIAEEAFDE